MKNVLKAALLPLLTILLGIAACVPDSPEVVLERYRPDSSSLNATVETPELKIEWGKTTHTITDMAWAVNDYEVFDSVKSRNAGYNNFLNQVSPAMVRIHNASINQWWGDSLGLSWRFDLIKRCMSNIQWAGNAREGIMLNISKWPQTISSNNVLTDAEEDIWVEQVRKLVVFNRDSLRAPRKITHWELLNELDNNYERANALPRLWNLWRKLAEMVKKEDPAMKVGGPALTFSKRAWVDGFMERNADLCEFFTYHYYSSPNPSAITDSSITRNSANWTLGAIKPYMQRYPNMKVWCTEYNIQWTWTPFEARHANSVGAIFQLVTNMELAKEGLHGNFVWHAKGNAYGLIDGSNSMRATGSLYRLAKNHFTGSLVAASTKTPGDGLLVYAFRKDGVKTVVIANRSNRNFSLTDNYSLLGPGTKLRNIYRIDLSNNDYTSVPANPGVLVLTPFSLTVFTSR